MEVDQYQPSPSSVLYDDLWFEGQSRPQSPQHHATRATPRSARSLITRACKVQAESRANGCFQSSQTEAPATQAIAASQSPMHTMTDAQTNAIHACKVQSEGRARCFSSSEQFHGTFLHQHPQVVPSFSTVCMFEDAEFPSQFTEQPSCSISLQPQLVTGVSKLHFHQSVGSSQTELPSVLGTGVSCATLPSVFLGHTSTVGSLASPPSSFGSLPPLDDFAGQPMESKPASTNMGTLSTSSVSSPTQADYGVDFLDSMVPPDPMPSYIPFMRL